MPANIEKVKTYTLSPYQNTSKNCPIRYFKKYKPSLKKNKNKS